MPDLMRQAIWIMLVVLGAWVLCDIAELVMQPY